MADNLVIVESPAKAGTIEKYLGTNYQVVASMGHVRDLPASKLGVDVENQFIPQYVTPPKARPALKKLKDALKGKKSVYLATDLDREGEAIAWHVSQALGLDKEKSLTIHRITFDEITKPAIQKAIKEPRELNLRLVDAQQARRVLDRLVGYTLSPVLWKKVMKGLSAGRVQSVALRLIVDREEERNAFKPVEYWSIEAKLHTDKIEETLKAKLISFQGKKIEQLTITTEGEARKMEEALQGASYVVSSIEQKKLTRRPLPPYTTATFQQDAVNKLKVSSKQAMRVAQQLYEAGYITYMRTDSVSLASEAVQGIRSYVQATYGESYIPAKPNFYQAKSARAQEAHEAIRPTDVTRKAADFTGEAINKKVYDLIWRRAVASQMAPAQLEQTAASITAGEGIFKANGQRIVFPGFMEVYVQDQKEELLPLLREGQPLALEELLTEQHFTEPPPRFSEATLIKVLEEYGIGRPSTYAPTIDTLVARNYVRIEQRRLIPEQVGMVVIKLLKEHFSDIVDISFTANMEEQLDSVADGATSYESLLTDFWNPFNTQVQSQSELITKVDMSEETDVVCPTCGSPMRIKYGRFGKFLACSAFPDCKTTMPLESPKETGLICPIDGKPLQWKRARRGQFLGCSGYPSCTFALWKPEQLPAKIKELEEAGTKLECKDQSLQAFATLPKHA